MTLPHHAPTRQERTIWPAFRAARGGRATEWFNTEAPLKLDALRGRVVMICAFQMLCPGCVSHGIPQAQRVAELFRPDDVQVIGLHTVFEHHEAMAPQALRAFLHEYKVAFPVGVDAPEGDGIPQTMRAYGMQGTPTTILIDREGRLRRQAFGRMSDLQLGAEIMALVAETQNQAMTTAADDPAAEGVCTPEGCR